MVWRPELGDFWKEIVCKTFNDWYLTKEDFQIQQMPDTFGVMSDDGLHCVAKSKKFKMYPIKH